MKRILEMFSLTVVVFAGYVLGRNFSENVLQHYLPKN